MKRSAIWLWSIGSLLSVALLTLIGLWAAVCWWPDFIGPRLPPWLAFRIAGMGEAGFAAGSQRFGEFSEYWMDHDQPPDDIAACNATLCRALRGSRDDQLLALRVIRPGNTGFVGATPERNALVFALTTSPDEELRGLARYRWTSDGITASKQIRAITPEASAIDHSPLSPDRWVPGPAAGIAWRMTVFIDWRYYDHIRQSRYQKYLRESLDRLLTYDDGQGRFSDDARDNAVIISALAALYSTTADPALKPIIQRAVDHLGQDRARLERLWQEDTTTALMTAMCINSLLGASMQIDGLALSQQRVSFARWWATRTVDAPPPWFTQGKMIEVPAAERWAAATMGGHWCRHDPEVKAPTPPLRLADPAECTPLSRYMAMMAATLYGDPRWRDPFYERQRALIDTQIITPDHDGLEGCWPAHGDVSVAWQTVFSVLELSMDWPYNPVTRSR